MMEMAMHGFDSSGIEVDKNSFESCVGNIEQVNNATGAKLDVEVNLKDLKDLHDCKGYDIIFCNSKGMPSRSADNAVFWANGENFQKDDLYLHICRIMNASPCVSMLVLGKSEMVKNRNLPTYADLYKFEHHFFLFQFNAHLRGAKQQTENYVFINKNYNLHNFSVDQEQ